MPYKVEVLRGGTLVHTRVVGVLTEEESLAHARELVTSAEILPGFVELFDARGVTAARITEDTIRGLDAVYRLAPEKMKGSKAAVVTDDPGAYRLQHAFPDDGPRRVIVFSCVETACRWLGVDDWLEA